MKTIHHSDEDDRPSLLYAWSNRFFNGTLVVPVAELDGEFAVDDVELEFVPGFDRLVCNR